MVLRLEGSRILARFFRRRSPARRGVFKHKGEGKMVKREKGCSFQAVVRAPLADPFVDSDVMMTPLWRCGHRHRSVKAAMRCLGVGFKRRFSCSVGVVRGDGKVVF